MGQVFLDKSKYASGMLMYGDAYQDTTTYRHNGGSLRIATAGVIRGLNGSAYAPEAQDFTFEAWVYQTAYPGSFYTRYLLSLLSSAANSFYYGIESNGTLTRLIFKGYNGSASDIVTAYGDLPNLNEWAHIAVERYNNQITHYLNGVGSAPVSFAGTIPAPLQDNTSIIIGGRYVESGFPVQFSFAGPVDSLRMTIGEARYKGNFTPDSGPFIVGSGDSLWDKVVLLVDGTVGQHSTTVVEPIPKKLALVPVLATTIRHAPLVIEPRDEVYGGNGVIYGTVANKGTPNAPVYRRVRLFRDRDAICIREMWSDPITGAYSFPNIDPGERYTVLSYDHTGNYRAVVGDNLTPEIMP